MEDTFLKSLSDEDYVKVMEIIIDLPPRHSLEPANQINSAWAKKLISNWYNKGLKNSKTISASEKTKLKESISKSLEDRLDYIK